MIQVYLQIFQIVLQVVLVVLFLRSKKSAAALPEPARRDRIYGLNMALVCSGLVFLISIGLLVGAILKVSSPTT